MEVGLLILAFYNILSVNSYTNDFILPNLNPVDSDEHCRAFNNEKGRAHFKKKWGSGSRHKLGHFRHVEDPFRTYQTIIDEVLFGANEFAVDEEQNENNNNTNETVKFVPLTEETDQLAHYLKGNIMRAERFMNQSSVHLPILEYLHRDHCFLQLTNDYMQTALNAFAIFIKGSLKDILNLPQMYVLKSTRTIAMMKITREKLVATWDVVKGDTPTKKIPLETLELYRPLFKYVNGKEIAKLNLSDENILAYIGTHADLERHQVGVIANTYIHTNPNWSEPKYLNLMNNLLCGIPMTFMRKIPENTYLQLTDQVFYHIRACDPLQRRFYLAMMTRTQALGKSYSWSARDVSRLGLLLVEVEGPALSTINPQAMSGITAQVMMEMPADSLRHITEMQLRYIAPKPLSILARKLKRYQDEIGMFDSAYKEDSALMSYCLLYLVYFLFMKI